MPALSNAVAQPCRQAWNVIQFRRGLDGRSIPPVRVPGEKTRNDRSAFLSILANILADKTPGRRVRAMFCDSAYGAPYVELLKRMGYENVHEVNFGETLTPDEQHCANMRAYMWKQSKDWLLYGGIPNEPRLESDATGPGHHLDKKDRLVLESKESMADRGVHSPDDWDAFALTFAAPVAPKKGSGEKKKPRKPRFTGRGPSGGGLTWTH